MCVVAVELMMERLQPQPLQQGRENQMCHLKDMEQSLGQHYLQLDKVPLPQMGKVQLHQQQDKERHQQLRL